MCGICGELTFEPGASVRPEVLTSMRDRLLHRGPDDRGLFVAESGRAGLGFRRLRIIDLSADANQPMSNEDGTVWVVFNGEIYNFRDLRAELVGARPPVPIAVPTPKCSSTCTRRRGPEFVEAIDGMFAIAMWDERAGRLVLARDRAGKKPLFYYRDERRIVFASEIKALFAHPDVPIRIDEATIPDFFMHGYVPRPGTFYQGVRQVEPATVADRRARRPPDRRGSTGDSSIRKRPRRQPSARRKAASAFVISSPTRSSGVSSATCRSARS